jgi:hypothetical protein
MSGNQKETPKGNIAPAIISGIVAIIVALIGGYFSTQHIVKSNAYVLTGLVDVPGQDATKKQVLECGRGPREVVSHVDFSKEFDDSPTVIASINTFDINDGSTIELLQKKIPGQQDEDIPAPGARLRVFTRNVTTKGFDCVIQTWSKTEVYEVTVYWYALPSKIRSN